MLNTCSFIGRLVVEPEFKTTGGGTPFTKARIAVQRDIPKNKGTPNENGFKEFDSDFIPFAVWGPTAQYIAKVQKGKMICISGRMQTSQYTDAQGGKQTGFELNVESWYTLEKNEKNDTNDYARNQQPQQQQPQQQQPQQSFGQNQASFGQQQPQQGFQQPQQSFGQPQQSFGQPQGFGQNQNNFQQPPAQNNGFGNGFNSPTSF